MAFWARALTAAGAAVVLAAFPLYRFWTLLFSQIAPPRAWGVLAAAAGAFLLVGVAGALLARVLPAPAPAVRRAGLTLFWTGALYNVALLGLQIFYPSVMMAPRPVLAIALLAPLLLAARFWRTPPADQAMLAGGLARLGTAALAPPLLALPYVGWAAAHDEPRLAGAPDPLVGAAVRPDAPKRIVLVTFDALRLQSTTVFDPSLDVTPNLAKLAAEGTAFMNVRASADMTAIALPALGAGLWPGTLFRRPADRHAGAIVRSGQITGLAGHLAPAGYVSAACMMGISAKTIGFDGEYVDDYSSRPVFGANTFNVREFVPIRPALGWVDARIRRLPDQPDPQLGNPVYATRAMFRRGLAFLKAHPERAFVWIHLLVPHDPYHHIPPPGDLPDHTKLGRYRWVGAPWLKDATPQRMAIYRGWYHDYARFGDFELGRFVADMKAAGLYDDALLVVTSDHGEDLVTKAHPTHADGVITERIARVPLVVRRPKGGAARRDDRLASSVDLAPSVLDLVYDRLPAGLSGVSLWGPADPDRVAYTWALQARFFPQYAGKMPAAAAAYQGRHRYMEAWDEAGRGPTATLADLAADPEGATDLSGRMPALRDHLRARLKQANVTEPVP